MEAPLRGHRWFESGAMRISKPRLSDLGSTASELVFGAPGRSRTRNLMGRNHLLYPVELQGPLAKVDTCPGHVRLVPH